MKRNLCANKLCNESLIEWKESGLYNGWTRQGRTGTFFCPSCRRVITRTFAYTVTATTAALGIGYAVAKWWFGL